MRVGLLTSFACVLFTSTLASTANAQQDREEEARALFMAGRAAYDGGRYEAALSRFQEAYELSGRAELLYNIGQTADRLRQDEVALDAFERFLSETSEGSPNRDVAERRVEFLRRSIGPEPDPDPEVSDPDPGPQDDPELDPATMDADDLAMEDDDPDPAAPPAGDEEAESGGSLWWVGVIAGVVVVGAVIGLAVALSGGDGEPQYAESDLGETIFALGEW